MAKHLSDAQIARFHEDGFVFPVDVMTAAEAAAYRARMEALETHHGPLKYAMKPYLTVTVADEIAHNETLLDAVEDIIGPDIMVWDGAFINKEPRTGNFVSWHQDLTYWGLCPPEGVVSTWTALSPVHPENGCMRAIPGSHQDGILLHRDSFGADNMLSRGQRLIDDVDEDAAADIVLAPGQMSLHHGHVIHGSNPNTSDERRIGLNLQFVACSARQTLIDDDTAMLVRGTDRHGHFAPEPRPPADFAPESIAFAEMLDERRRKVLFHGADADDVKMSRFTALS